MLLHIFMMDRFQNVFRIITAPNPSKQILFDSSHGCFLLLIYPRLMYNNHLIFRRPIFHTFKPLMCLTFSRHDFDTPETMEIGG